MVQFVNILIQVCILDPPKLHGVQQTYMDTSLIYQHWTYLLYYKFMETHLCMENKLLTYLEEIVFESFNCSMAYSFRIHLSVGGIALYRTIRKFNTTNTYYKIKCSGYKIQITQATQTLTTNFNCVSQM